MLPFLKKFAKKKPISYFLVLILKNEKANAVIFEEIEGKIKVIGQQEEYFKESIENTNGEEFLRVLDKTISKAEETLPENIETQKTIFGVKEDWIEGNKIKKEYLLKLKSVSDSLGLVPIGFLVIPEAIAHFLEKEEGAPISAVFVDCGKKFVSISLIRTGKLIETKTSQIHDSIIFTVDTLLKHLEAPEILPSRIILYDGDENLNQEFISHQWSKSLPFLHLPQITNLASGFDAKAVLFGAASQMGFEVLKDSVEKEEETRETQEEIFETQEKIEEEPSLNAFTEDFGFEKEKDVARNYIETPNISSIVPEGEEPEITKEDVNVLPKTTFSVSLKNIFFKIPGLLKKITGLRKSFSSSPIPANILSRKIVVFPLIIIIIFLIFFIFSLFGSHTNIVLSINPKIVEQAENVTFTTDSIPTGASDNIVAGQFMSVSEDGQTSIPATGKKEVGDKAKGTVTLFNSTLTTTTFSQGTKITSSNNLVYVLSNDVTVASGSGDAISGISPGKANVNILANDIGPEYNLPSNTKFSIGENPLIAAKNDNPFSGGTKKEVTVVSKNDTDKLLTNLEKNLEQKAKDDLQKNMPSDKRLLPTFVNEKVTQKTFDKNIGDQSNSVTLKGTVSYEGLSYSQNDLTSFAKNLLQNKIQKDLTVNYNDIKIEVKDISKKDDKNVEASLNIKGLLIPKLDEENLTKELAGMPYDKAKNKLLKLPQVSNAKITSSLAFPFLNLISKTPKNIKISLNVND